MRARLTSYSLEATETVLLLGFFFMKERRLYTLDNGGKGAIRKYSPRGVLFYLSLAKRIPLRLARKPKAIINEDVARLTCTRSQ